MTRRSAGPNGATSVRLWGLNIVLAACAAALYAGAVRGLPALPSPVHIPWYVLGVLFCLSEICVVHLRFRSGAHSFSLSEIPLVLGLFLASPSELVLAQLVGAGVALTVHRRQPPIKLVFNLSVLCLLAAIASVVLHRLATAEEGPAAWAATLVVMGLITVLGVALILVAVALSEGRVKPAKALQVLGFALVGAVSNSALALECVAVLRRQVMDIALLAVPVGTLFVAYRAYTAERRKHEHIQQLYRSSDLLQRSYAGGSAVEVLLAHFCEVFRADVAEVGMITDRESDPHLRTTLRRGERVETSTRSDPGCLEEVATLLMPERPGAAVRLPNRDPALQDILTVRGLRDAMVAPLRGEERVIGMVLVGDRLGDLATFDRDDLRLFETLAAQVGVALENGRLEDQLKHRIFHDPLTNLANRALFTDRLDHALMRRRGNGATTVAVLFIDLDDFKMVNDSLGHGGGDDMLRAVAERLRASTRPFDTVARLGGDEFTVLLEDVRDARDALPAGERIIDALRAPFTVLDCEVAMHASVGIADAGATAIDAEELLRRADVAMYRAKEHGKGRCEVYETGMRHVVAERLELKTALERALENDELVVHYQPIVSLRTDTIVSLEALVRWRHPSRGLVGPDVFIRLAEDTGLIVGVGHFVLESACRQARAWSLGFPEHVRLEMSVNLSPRQLRSPGFVADLQAVLERTGLDPSLLTLEITESFMIEEVEQSTSQQLHLIKEVGVGLSIDDFGTGYSSLSSLQHMPVDCLKIAKPFVDRVTVDARGRAFAQAIIRLGRTLGLTTVAEGVEHAEQRDLLRRLHCDMAQGYFFARPMPVQAVDALLGGVAHMPG